MHSLSVMLKPASGQCNMHCDYCFYCDEMEQRAQASYGFMSEETLQNVIRKTMLNADREISFSYQGGEPTLAGLAFFEKAEVVSVFCQASVPDRAFDRRRAGDARCVPTRKNTAG